MLDGPQRLGLPPVLVEGQGEEAPAALAQGSVAHHPLGGGEGLAVMSGQ